MTKATNGPIASDQKPTDDRAASSSALEFPIVGLGASAGGLDALKKFFSAMPADSGMAFVVVQHLDPTHESMMADLLTRCTAMPVRQSEDGMAVEPDCVYVIPPKWYLGIKGTRLRLTEPKERRGMRMAIDAFFCSLAEDQHNRSIVVILSGTGSDGSAGIKEIKAQGGMVMAQDPDTVTHDGMPRSAINTGFVDLVLPVEDMPQALQQYAEHPYLNGHTETKTLVQPAGDDLHTVLALLQAHQKLDFRHYKHTTLVRRMERRMGLNHLRQIADYLALLRHDPVELDRLSKDLLIGVTGFFRDPDIFSELDTQVIQKLVAEADLNDTLRVWVAGCSTGEEAYTLAMLFFDTMADQEKRLGLQIFASDIDKEALEKARIGSYPASIAADTNPERLKRYFVLTENDAYEVNKELREAVVFAHQNLINDPPFSKLDLISCRNLMIYLQPKAQDKSIALFHFALKRDRYLLLGSSESIGRHDNLFATVSKQARIYQRLNDIVAQPIDFPLLDQIRHSNDVETAPDDKQSVPQPPRFKELAKSWLLDEFAPAAVIINRCYEVLYFHGPVVNYLDIPSGEPNHNLLDMLREGLLTRVRSAIHRAFRDNQKVMLECVRLNRNGRHHAVSAQFKPIKSTSKDNNSLLLVAFRDLPATKENLTDKKEANQTDEAIIGQLEEELKASKQDLQSTIEEMETSNEEVMSINEELQSTNEELETSKEELQSLNEELSTVNNQLQDKVAELEDTNNDMENLFTNTEVATVFLDTKLHIKRYTPATIQLFNLIPSDQGRPLTDIAQKFTDTDLIADAQQVLAHLAPLERHVHDAQGRWFRRRVLPYRTHDNRIDGVVVSFVDVTELHNSEAAAHQRLAEIEGIYKYAPVGLCVLDRALRYVRVNEQLAEINGFSVQDHLGKTVRELLPHLADQVEPQLRRVLESGEAARNLEISGETPAQPGVVRHWLEHWYPLRGDDGAVYGINIVAEEITQRKRQENYQIAEKAVAQHLVGGVPLAEAIPNILNVFAKNFEIAICSLWIPELGSDTLSCCGFNVPGAAEKTRQSIKSLFDETQFAAGDTLIGTVWAERKPHWINDIGADPLFQRVEEATQLDLHTGIAFPLLADRQRLGVMSFYSQKSLAVDESLLATLVRMGQDLGEYVLRIRSEAALLDSEQQFRTIVQSAPIPIMLYTLDGETLMLNDTFTEVTGYILEDIPDGKVWLEKASSTAAEKTAEVNREFEKWHDTKPLPSEKEALIQTKFGVQRHWLIRGSLPFQRVDGQQFMVSMAVDISAHKEAEQRLRGLTYQLEAANQRKNEFLSVLGHELRNPLAAVSNGLSMMQQDASKADWALTMMKDNLTTIGRLLDDLLDLNRISQGRIELKRQPTPLASVIKRAVAAVNPRAVKKDQSIDVDIPEQPLILDADPIRLEQIFGNLLTNAIKFTGTGGRIHIQVRHQKKPNQVTVEITDTGRGIPAEELEKIFEPFTQITDEKAPNDGLGIGLALVKQLVMLHGGTITARSEGKDQGSRFEVSLPLAAQQATVQDKAMAMEEPLALAPGLRVLAVDDNDANVTTLSMILETWDCNVVTAIDGESALRIARDFQPQAMILDIGLPDISGYELVKRLREELGNETLAIALSGYGHEEAKETAKSAGFDHHLTKPVDLDALRQLLSQAKANPKSQ
ncbi:MAG: chemotaxis protein CheB [Candidatus Competibacteraceae bacterium]|jgi:two-component system CheB/CheR fusion protein|nr:chemotaxis protein CheB [Candidatus Competibacteraceae bacterium]